VEETVSELALKISDVSLRFGGLKAVNNVSLNVPSGSLVGMIGPNGAGKTSLLNCVSGHYRVSSGSILLNGVEITRFVASRISKIGLVRTFQNPLVLRHATVRENLMVGCDLAKRAVKTGRGARTHARDSGRTVTEIADQLGMVPFLDRTAGDLPVGSLKLIEIGRALAAAPSVLLLDEPTAGMNATERRFAGQAIRQICTESGLTVLLVEHDVQFVSDICDRMIAFEFGELIADGAPADVLSSERVIAGYLGADFAAGMGPAGMREGKASA
jgi:branched-chain amino acid transport system ATP-binding protein